MNKRLRKKKGKVIDSELWDFDQTICKWIIPRLKRFKQINIGYPGNEEFPTPESWDDALDKMIYSFELAQKDPLDLLSDNYNIDEYKRVLNWYQKEVHEGLQLFVDNFFNLWI